MRPVPCTRSPADPAPIHPRSDTWPARGSYTRLLVLRAEGRPLSARPLGWLARSLMFCPPVNAAGREDREKHGGSEAAGVAGRKEHCGNKGVGIREEGKSSEEEGTEKKTDGKRGREKEREGRAAHFAFPTCCSVQTSCIACSPIRATVTLKREWD